MRLSWRIGRMAGGLGLALAIGFLVGPPKGISQQPPRPGLKDPTQPSDKIREKLATPATGTPNGPAAQPAMPAMILKGRIIGGVGAPAALLEINGAVRMVRVGNRFGGGNLVLRVTEISATAVRIEVESTKEIIVVQ